MRGRVISVCLACWLVFVISWSAIIPCAGQSTAASKSASQLAGGNPLPTVVYLHTEKFPWKGTPTTSITPFYTKLSREIVRQSIAMTISDEFGVPIRDEALGESVPENANVIHLWAGDRPTRKGKWTIRLFEFEPDRSFKRKDEWRLNNRLWEKLFQFDPQLLLIYQQALDLFDPLTRQELVTALAKVGLTPQVKADSPKKPTVSESNATDDEIESALAKVDFIAQYDALRLAHVELERRGENATTLGQLVRGYAQLAMLIHHHWNCSADVCQARSLIYAERLLRLEPDSELARWHHAYGRALVGIHVDAIADLKLLKRSAAATAEKTADDSSKELPAWIKLIEPIVNCDRHALRAISEADETIRPWALQLEWHVTELYRQPSWMNDMMPLLADETPQAYGVYADLAHHAHYLGPTRTAAALAPRAFDTFLASSLQVVHDLPISVAEGLPKTKPAAPGRLVHRSALSSFSKLPGQLAIRLRTESPVNDAPLLSWSALGSLLSEEQFAEIANYLKVATNAVESSLAEEVAELLPLVQDHRFANFIESYRLGRTDSESLNELAKSLEITDVNQYMVPMTTRFYNASDGTREKIGEAYFFSRLTNVTALELVGLLQPLTYTYSADFREWFEVKSDLLRDVSPHCEFANRIALMICDAPTLAQLQQWESELREDCGSFAALGEHYAKLNLQNEAIRCYQKSLEILPTNGASQGLANLYRESGEIDKWESTLLDALNTQDMGLEHGSIYTSLANGYIARGEWRKAKSPAEKAASSWSGNGLGIAFKACEGLAQWEESERWVRELSESYPSYSGGEWYFWCRRTGRGDVNAALKIAEKYFANPPAKNRTAYVRAGVFEILREHPEKALQHYRAALAFYPSATCTWMVAKLVGQLEDEQAMEQFLEEAEHALALKYQQTNRENEPEALASREIFHLMRSGDQLEERLTRIKSELGKLSNVDTATRCAFCYFTGLALDRLGRLEDAKKFWRLALIEPHPDIYYFTLAGAELVKHSDSKKSRPDDDELDENTHWPESPK